MIAISRERPYRCCASCVMGNKNLRTRRPRQRLTPAQRRRRGVGGADVYFEVVFHHTHMGNSTAVPISTMRRRRATTSHHFLYSKIKCMIAYLYFLCRDSRYDLPYRYIAIWTNPRRYSDIDKRSKSCTIR